MDPRISMDRPVKTLIRMHVCTDRSETSMGAHVSEYIVSLCVAANLLSVNPIIFQHLRCKICVIYREMDRHDITKGLLTMMLRGRDTLTG